MDNFDLIWSDNIDIEKNIGWFGGGPISALFEINFKNNKYRYLDRFQDCKIDDARKYSICKKYKDKIFLFPIYGDKIWIYNIVKRNFTILNIKNSEKYDKLRFLKVFIYKNKLYALSYDIHAILEIDPEKEIIVNLYNIPKRIEHLAGNAILSDNIIYCCSNKSGSLCQFNIDTKEIICRDIPLIKNGIYTINLVKTDEFWFSGFDKMIYVWNSNTNVTMTISEFPEEFGIYRINKDKNLILDTKSIVDENMFFITSINLNEYIWYIPFRTNKIIYVHKDTHQIKTFDIPEEEEDYRMWKRNINCKYFVEYIREERYIGLYSLRNNVLLELDTKKLAVKRRNIYLMENSRKQLRKEVVKEILYFIEGNEVQNILFKMSIEKRKEIERNFKQIGKKIYQNIL